MPRTAITVQSIVRTGLEATYESFDQANGMSFSNAGATAFVHIKNGDASGKTLTIVTSYTGDGLALADRTVSLAATSDYFIGPFPNGFYGNSTNTVYLDIDSGTSVTIAVLQVSGS